MLLDKSKANIRKDTEQFAVKQVLNDGHHSKSSTFADDTSMVITNPDPMELTNSLNANIIKINRWFKSNHCH
jgi:hypothetical protein